MLTIYRRHTKTCKHRDKGRKYRHCPCPIWVDGFLGGKEMRESLQMRDWQRAQDKIREWEAEDRRASQPILKPTEEAWAEFLADIEARKLHNSTIRKYKLLRRQMEDFALRRRLSFLTDFDLSKVSQFRSEWKDGLVRVRRSLNGFARSSVLRKSANGCRRTRRWNSRHQESHFAQPFPLRVKRCCEYLPRPTNTRKRCQVMASKMDDAFGGWFYCFGIVECALGTQ